MGWVGYFEDNRDQLQENLARAEQAMASSATSAEEKLRTARRALADARYLFDEITGHLDVATSPELDLAIEIQNHRIAAFEANRKLDRSKWALTATENTNLELEIKIERLEAEVFRLRSLHRDAVAWASELEPLAERSDELQSQYDRLAIEAREMEIENADLKSQLLEYQDPARWKNEMNKYLSLSAIRRNRPER